MLRKQSSDRGFTLIEILIVITLIVVLASMGMASYTNSVRRAREAVLREDLFRIRDAIDQFYADKNKYPQTLADLVSEKYLREIPKDPMTNSADTQASLVESGRRFLYPNYRQPALVIERGDGAVLWDVAGKRYLDFFAGIAVSALGHAHPALVRAVAEQAARVVHVSNYFFNAPNVRLAQKLCETTGMDRAFFSNSGTEAIEACLKLVRRHFWSNGQPERLRVIAFENSFHGRTLGALAATGQSKYKEGFGPLPNVTHVPYGDAAAVAAQMAPDVAAILVEPVQGEGGVLPALIKTS